MTDAEIPPCAEAMGCLCAGHARGNAARVPCDTTECQDVTYGNFVNLTVLPSGDLEIDVVANADIDWDRLLKERDDNALCILIDDIRGNSEWDMVDPEDIGAMTLAPIISDGVMYPDSGARVVFGRVWWFPNYAVENLIETLHEKGHVVLTAPADNRPSIPVDCALCKREGCETCNGQGVILFRVENESEVSAT